MNIPIQYPKIEISKGKLQLTHASQHKQNWSFFIFVGYFFCIMYFKATSSNGDYSELKQNATLNCAMLLFYGLPGSQQLLN